jgi:alkylation response protein AidB-like acyl-CoA dehydrogenase
MHNFQLREEHEMVLDTVRKFAQDHAAKDALENDEHGRFVRANFDQLAELGLTGLPIAESAGGAGMGWLAFVVAVEEIAKACGSTARVLVVHTAQCGKALEGLPAASELLGEICAGSKLWTYVGPEFRFTAAQQGDGFVLQGTAALVTAATEAGGLVVAAALDGEPAIFAIDRRSTEAAPVRALGFKAAAPSTVRCAHVAAPATALLARGEPARSALRLVRLSSLVASAALACGLAQASLDQSKRHARERIAFGKPLFGQQAVAHKLVAMVRAIHAGRHPTYHAARLLDAGQEALEHAILAKLEAVEGALLCADEGIQVHGGYGYVNEYHVERHYRDAKTLEVLDDGTESLRDMLAAEGQSLGRA